MTLLEPSWLWGCLLLPVIWRWPKPVTDRRHGLIRSVLLLLVIVGLARPSWVTDETQPHLVVVLDLSNSVEPSDKDAAWALAKREAEAEPTAIKSLILLGSGSPGSVPGYDHVEWVEDTGSSPLGAALSRASARIPAGSPGALLLVSDGRSTDRDWAVVTQSLSARGIPVNTVSLAPRVRDVRVVGIATDAEPRVGQVCHVQVSVEGTDGDAEVIVTADDQEVARGRTQPRGAGVGQADLTFEPSRAGFLQLVATVTDSTGDSHPGNESLARILAVQEPLRVLYLGQRVDDGGPALDRLLGPGFEVDSGPPGQQLSPEVLDRYDVAFLDDRPAASVPTEAQRALVSAVAEHGLGLVVAGGGLSFGAGGWANTPVEEALPVEFLHKEEKKDPSTSLAIIIDTSGSMAGNRIVLAKEVTRLAMRRLLPHDKVGIVEFYGAKRWAAPLQSAANAIDLQRALNRLDAGGGTVLFPAVEEAYYGLRNVQTRYKHVLILTDAGVETGPYEQLLRRMAADGINVSTVLVGPGRHSEFLVQLAEWGNGRYYNASDRFHLPEVMLKQPSTSRLPSYRPGVHEVQSRTGPGWWGSVDPTQVPALSGYVETKKRNRAEVVLETVAGGHPVVASWQWGLGRVTSLMTEPTGPGTRSWQDWDGYGPLLARLISRTAADHRDPFRFDVLHHAGFATIRAHRRPGVQDEPVAQQVLKGRDADQPLPLRPYAPGKWMARVAVAPGEIVQVRGAPLSAPSRPHWAVTDLADQPNSETQVPRALSLDLRALAFGTGGEAVDIRAPRARNLASSTGGQRLRELRPWLFLLALLVYVGDVAWRRWPRSSAASSLS